MFEPAVAGSIPAAPTTLSTRVRYANGNTQPIVGVHERVGGTHSADSCRLGFLPSGVAARCPIKSPKFLW
jgi:hypothetical protein